MNNVTAIVLLSIFIPIGVVLGCAGLYVILKAFFLKKYSSYYDEYEKFIEREPYIEILTVLKVVDIILVQQEKLAVERMTTSANDEIKWLEDQISEINENKDRFAKQQIVIEDKINQLKDYKNVLFGKLDESKFFSCVSIVKKIEFQKKVIEQLSKEIQDNTKKYIDPLKDFDREKSKYEKIYASLSERLNKWEEDIQSDLFKSNVDKRRNDLETYLGEAQTAAHANDQSNLLKYFTLFKKQMYELIRFDNYYNKFKETLVVKSEQTFKKINNYIDSIKLNIGTDLSNLNIDSILENVKNEFADAKRAFYDLDIEATQENIEKYHTSLLSLSYQLTSELNAFNYFNRIDPFAKIKSYFSHAKERQKELVEQIEKIQVVDKMFYWNMTTHLQELNKIYNDISISIQNFTETFNQPSTSFISKQQNFQRIILLLETFFTDSTNCEKNIELFYNEGKSQGARYHRLKKTYINGLSEIKKFNINLSIEDNEKINNIENMKQTIENHISSQNINSNEKELKVFVDKFYEMIIEFLMTVQKKAVLVKLFSLINTEYAYKRIENNLFDKKVIESENLIVEGKYEEGIKELVKGVKGVIN